MKIKLRYEPDEYFTFTRRNTIPVFLFYLDLLRGLFYEKNFVYLVLAIIFGIPLLGAHLLFFALPILGLFDLLMASLKFIGDSFDKLMGKRQ